MKVFTHTKVLSITCNGADLKALVRDDLYRRNLYGFMYNFAQEKKLYDHYLNIVIKQLLVRLDLQFKPDEYIFVINYTCRVDMNVETIEIKFTKIEAKQYNVKYRVDKNNWVDLGEHSYSVL